MIILYHLLLSIRFYALPHISAGPPCSSRVLYGLGPVWISTNRLEVNSSIRRGLYQPSIDSLVVLRATSFAQLFSHVSKHDYFMHSCMVPQAGVEPAPEDMGLNHTRLPISPPGHKTAIF